MARNETTPAQVIYNAAGLPAMIGSSAGICRLCGCDGIGQKFNLWVKDTFTDHDKLFPGDIICHACQFCTVEASEQLATMMGKDKPQRMRNYSHFVHNGEWIPLSKGDKGRMIDLLKKFPPVAVIATSGQKHIIFRARLGWWQIEEQSTTPLANLWEILEVVTTMYNGGFSKDEITTGRYIQRRIGEYGVAKFIQHEDIVKRARGSNALELAIFLAQKDNEDGRIPDGYEVVSPDLAGNSRRLQTEIRPQHLGSIREQHQGGGIHQQGEQIYQLNLFSLAGSNQQ